MNGALAEIDPGTLAPRAVAAQTICVELRDFEGDEAEARRFLEDVERYGWGAVIVFGGELAAVEDLLAEAATRSEIPMLVTGDFERGLGQQFPRSGTVFPSLMAFGAAGDPALASAAGRAIGRDLERCGIHVNFAPVADLASEPQNPIIGTRGAGDDPSAAAGIVGAVVEGLQSAGVAAAVKHFPGHGRTTTDSHHAEPVVDADQTTLEKTDWVPFRAGLEAGAKIVMTTHVAFPSLEPDGVARPGTFSSAVNAVLKEAWGFEGVVCTDALMMGAVAGEPPASAAVRALDAGVDWLLMPPDPRGVLDGVAGAVEDGRLDPDRCRDAARRLLRLKAWAGAGEARDRGPRSHSAPLAEAVAGAALTADPVDPPAGAAWPDRAQWTVVLDGEIGREDVVFESLIAPENARRIVYVDTTEPPDEVRAAIAESGRRSANAWSICAVFDPVRAAKGRAGPSPLALEAIAAACEPARESILLVHSNPHIVSAIGAPSRIVWTYGEDAASQRAAVAFLRGALPARGRLPVRIRR